ncbi:MAG: flagellar biosynthesis protein FlhA [Endozoicomonadaceae bacterium]|nr:flagellar biosynthesis protein FlhA [Endozoicomonadaceae bacterium]
MNQGLSLQHLLKLGRSQVAIPLSVLVLMAMITLPMPPILLDVLFTFNIALSLLVLLVSIYSLRPLDFAAFPTVLLFATLMRLALNVASTRVVLLYGHTGGDAAGKVIQSFGEVVVGNNYVVGMVIFAILVIINFVVVTKGAGRISEVSARFTLDALPGKQMAVDADLNAGLIDQQQARDRRSLVTREADFYGSMDGASKFVRGDALAGLLILAINIIGGLLIGTLKHDLSFMEAFSIFALLTIGDGLVAQIPSLLLSIAAAIIVTRVSEAADVGEQISQQLFESPRALIVTSVIMVIIGLVPGMPHVAFIGLGLATGAIAYRLYKRHLIGESDTSKPEIEPASPQNATDKPLSWEDVPSIDPLGLEVGYRLIPMMDKQQGGQMLNQIKGIRKTLSGKLGFLIPSVHIRDNLSLKANSYSITLMGISVAQGEVEPDLFMAINPGEVYGDLEGKAVKDPAYGLDAIWINNEMQDQGVSLGYTVVDASTVITTHISKIIEEHAYELLGHDETEQLIEKLTLLSPKLAEELTPKKLSISQLQRVLKELLMDKVQISDLRTIANTLLENADQTTDALLLASKVREALKRSIVQNIIGPGSELPVVTLDEKLEQLLLSAQQQAQQSQQYTPDTIPLEPNLNTQLQTNLPEVTLKLQAEGRQPIMIVSPALRPMLAKYARVCTNGLTVLSFNEIPDNREILIIGKVG